LTEQSGVRLQKVLASAGVGSRRACEAMIAQGRVEVNGAPVTTQGVRIDPATAVVKVDGARVPLAESGLVYLALNKPTGVVSSMRDPDGRTDLSDYVADRAERLFHVGRLDTDTEGLILLTNDGELAHRLTHPSFEVPKTYVAEIRGPVGADVSRRLRAGVELDDGQARADRFRVTGRSGHRVMVEVVLHEGRKHIVRRLLRAVGHPVQRLVRIELGPVRLGELSLGSTRELSSTEIAALYAAVGL